MASSTLPVLEGTAPFTIPGVEKECFTWYKIVGDLHKAKHTPLVCVHGGPGMSHDYLESMKDLTETYGIPIVLYDQIGNARSTHLQEKNGDQSFWVESLFHSELQNLVEHLQLDVSGYDLLGHSWGGMMSATFAGQSSSPKGLRKLILANSPAVNTAWETNYTRYRSQMSEEVQKAITEGEEKEDWEGKEYEAAMTEFMHKHCCTGEWPEEFTRSFEWIGKDGTVAQTMAGPNEFAATGCLQHWTAIPAAKLISVPTLVISGTEEGASGEAVRPFLEEIKDVRGVVFEKSTHMPIYEEKEKWFQVLGDFLLA